MKTIVVSILILLTLCCSCKKEKNSPDEIYNSLFVCKDDQTVREDYTPAGDSDSPQDVRSVTKSVISTLIGIAINKGYIPSGDQEIWDYLSPLVSSIDEAKANLTISDLLSMSSGIEGSDLTSVSEYENWRSAPNQLAYTLEKQVIHQPGEVFAYNSGASHLLSIILTQATRMSTFQFAKEYLFQPQGIADH